MISVAEAEARILAGVQPVDTETVALSLACGRVTAGAPVARRTHPPRDVSAMDGYAIRAVDAPALPARLSVGMRIAAGDVPPRALQPGEAARIFTGAIVPDGADTIVIQENTEADGAAVVIREGIAQGAHIRAAGYDFREGQILFDGGRRLTAQDVGLLAAANVTELAVRRRPRVAFLATGEELVPPGTVPGPGQIVASTGLALAAMVAQWGGEAIDLGIAKDTEDDIRAKAKPGLDADVFVTLGGASVGDLDLVQPALAQLGLKVDFWKIAMRPGKPLMSGHIGKAAMIGLPGNPVSALVCARLFLEPLVRTLGGETWRGHRCVSARLGAPLAANDQRQDYLRASLEAVDGSLIATAFPRQDSGMLSLFAKADGLIVRPPHAAAAAAGEMVSVLPLAAWL